MAPDRFGGFFMPAFLPGIPMKNVLLPLALLAVLPLAATAADGDWSGSGELGFAATRGNARSENLNAKVQFKKEDATWKHNFFLTALRSKGEVKHATVVEGEVVKVADYDLTANRYEAGAWMGYKLDERCYVVGALRYENDDFAPFEYQWIASVGYGYTLLKNRTSELSVEFGPGYKRYQPVDVLGPESVDGIPLRHRFDSEGEVVGRGLVAWRHDFTDNASFVNTLLVESGADNTFAQNDAGLQVAINKSFALKLGYQVRHNSDVAETSHETDQLMTTNLVYKFGQ
jgi:putative salt-induced outer membrane protein